MKNVQAPAAGPVDGQHWNDGKEQHEAHLAAQDVANLFVVRFEGMQRQVVLERSVNNFRVGLQGDFWSGPVEPPYKVLYCTRVPGIFSRGSPGLLGHFHLDFRGH